MPIYVLKRTQEPDLAIEEVGDSNNPAILFIHGFSHSRHIWLKQAKSFLAHQFRLIFIDLRGHGNSEKPYHQYLEAERWATDIHDILKFLTIKRVLICAWSYAGLITCDFLRRYGEENVVGINFIAPFLSNGSKQDEAIVTDKALSILNNFASSNFDLNISATTKWIKLLTQKKLTQKDFNYLLAINSLCPYYVREDLLHRKANNKDLLKDLTLPLLLTHGEKDKIILPIASLNQKKLTPHAMLSLFKNIGHIPFWEAALKFNEELNQFADYCFKI